MPTPKENPIHEVHLDKRSALTAAGFGGLFGLFIHIAAVSGPEYYLAIAAMMIPYVFGAGVLGWAVDQQVTATRGQRFGIRKEIELFAKSMTRRISLVR